MSPEAHHQETLQTQEESRRSFLHNKAAMAIAAGLASTLLMSCSSEAEPPREVAGASATQHEDTPGATPETQESSPAAKPSQASESAEPSNEVTPETKPAVQENDEVAPPTPELQELHDMTITEYDAAPTEDKLLYASFVFAKHNLKTPEVPYSPTVMTPGDAIDYYKYYINEAIPTVAEAHEPGPDTQLETMKLVHTLFQPEVDNPKSDIATIITGIDNRLNYDNNFRTENDGTNLIAIDGTTDGTIMNVEARLDTTSNDYNIRQIKFEHIEYMDVWSVPMPAVVVRDFTLRPNY